MSLTRTMRNSLSRRIALRRPKGDDVRLVRSLGPVLVTVPNVRAMGISKAEETMQAAGFKTKTKKATNYLGLGYVVTSSPGAGKQAPKGSKITLYLV